MSAMSAVLRRHGARMGDRGGRAVALHFGSAASEAAACRSSVGLAERSDAGALELLGRREDVERALDRQGDHVWLELIGPHAGEALRAAGLDVAVADVVVLQDSPELAILLMPAAHGPAVWNLLLEAGEPFGIVCVGTEALEHLEASQRSRV
jgi:glycine cleavage system aminomethyltransferase T